MTIMTTITTMTTYTIQPQRVGALVLGPVKDPNGTLGPLRRKAMGGTINAPQGEVTHNDGSLKRDKRQVFRQTEPGKFLFSEFKVSKKVMSLLRHSQHVYREADGPLNSGELKKNLKNISCTAFIGLIASGKHGWQEE